LAWASIDTPACIRTCLDVNRVISWATSRSIMSDRAASVFSTAVATFDAAKSRRL